MPSNKPRSDASKKTGPASQKMRNNTELIARHKLPADTETFYFSGITGWLPNAGQCNFNAPNPVSDVHSLYA